MPISKRDIEFWQNEVKESEKKALDGHDITVLIFGLLVKMFIFLLDWRYRDTFRKAERMLNVLEELE
jgi:hypothetical protein